MKTDSRMRVLRIVYDLQFVGRTDPKLIGVGVPHIIYFDPVPTVAIVAELWGTGHVSNLDRDLRMLESTGELVRILHQSMQFHEYLRPDGKLVKVDSRIVRYVTTVNRRKSQLHVIPPEAMPRRGKNFHESIATFYFATVDGELVCEHNSSLPSRMEDRLDDGATRIESWRVGRDALVRLDNQQGKAGKSEFEKLRGRPKGTKKTDSLSRFVETLRKRFPEQPARIPVKALIQEYQDRFGQKVTYEQMRGRLRRELGRQSTCKRG